jgi:hypothetical protein
VLVLEVEVGQFGQHRAVIYIHLPQYMDHLRIGLVE